MQHRVPIDGHSPEHLHIRYMVQRGVHQRDTHTLSEQTDTGETEVFHLPIDDFIVT